MSDFQNFVAPKKGPFVVSEKSLQLASGLSREDLRRWRHETLKRGEDWVVEKNRVLLTQEAVATLDGWITARAVLDQEAAVKNAALEAPEDAGSRENAKPTQHPDSTEKAILGQGANGTGPSTDAPKIEAPENEPPPSPPGLAELAELLEEKETQWLLVWRGGDYLKINRRIIECVPPGAYGAGEPALEARRMVRVGDNANYVRGMRVRVRRDGQSWVRVGRDPARRGWSPMAK